ncbi:MAG: FG-GAP repeat domain-containing protein, partial [Candidatus Aminicenantales bacterium]
LSGDGAGRFSAAEGSPYHVAFRPYAVALGDLDGDRKLDLVAAHDDITLLTVLLNDGQGRFRPSPGSPVDIGERGGEVVLADFNHDGKLDLATGTAAHHLAVWLGDGAGRFSAAPGSPYPTPRGPWSLAVGDLNGDGKPDLVVAGVEAGSITVLLGL